jgi:circadian clock protein KaiC
MATRSVEVPPESTAASGIEGLDNILGGGFATGRLYLIQGVPGAGKTTLAMQFLLEGMRQGEAVLYITLSETSDELISVGRSHGWDLRGLPIHEIIPSEESLRPEQQYTMFHPSEVELSETSKAIVEARNAGAGAP